MVATPTLWRSESQVNTTDAAARAGGVAFQGDGQVVALADGGYVVVWEDASRAYNPDGSAILGQRYDALGTRIGGEVFLSGTVTGSQSAPAVVAMPWGFALAYVDAQGGDPDILVRHFDPGGNIIRMDRIDTGANPTTEPDLVAFADGSYAVAYRIGGSHPEVVARVVGAGGSVGTAFSLHSQPFDGSYGVQLAPLANGNFVAAFVDPGTVDSFDFPDFPWARVFSPAGTLVAANRSIPTQSGAGVDSVDVAGLAGGGFVVVCAIAGVDADGQGILASIYTDNNSLVTQFVVNTTQSGHQNEPNVVALRDGGFLITWEDDAADRVRAQRFDASGNRVGSQFTARDGVAADSPAAAVLIDGRVAYAIGDVSSGDADVTTSIWNIRTVVIHSDGGGDSATVSVLENASAVTTVVATDTDGDAPAYSIVGGADAARFRIDAATGVLSFVTAPDFEAPADADGDNSYVVRVRASGGGLFDEQNLTVDVIDENENLPSLGDVLWRHDDGTVATASHDLGAVPNNWRIATTGDFDADGDTDILWRHRDGMVVIWEMEDGQYLTNHNIAFASVGWEIVDAGDFDADGDADVLWRHRDGAVVTWEMEDGQYLINHNIAFASTGWEIDGLGDFNADGDADVIWRHHDGAVVTWEMEDGNYVQNHNIAFGSTSWQIQGTGDFDGDGDDDILWRHRDGAVVTWEMQDGNYVTNRNLPSEETAWQIAGTGDFDADRSDDILWRHSDGTVVTWDMQGGQLAQVHNFGIVSNAWHIVRTGEFDLA